MRFQQAQVLGQKRCDLPLAAGHLLVHIGQCYYSQADDFCSTLPETLNGSDQHQFDHAGGSIGQFTHNV